MHTVSRGDAIQIADAAIAIATVAFLITQIHLYRTGKLLIRKSEESWARVDRTISKVQADFQSQIDQIRADVKSSGGNDAKTLIAEVGILKDRLNGIPQFIEDRLSKVSENLSENFVRLQTAIDQRITEIKSSVPRGPIGTIVDPREAQEASVLKRKANEIVGKLDEAALASSFGGRLAMIMDGLGYPDLKDWMVEHPAVYSLIVQEIQKRPALRSRMDSILGGPQGHPTGPPGPQSPISDYHPGIN